MSYVILVNNDDTLYGSVKKRIMQRQKLVNELVFVVDPTYNGMDITDASVLLEYVLPVSRKYDTINLVLDDERYNDCYLQYKLPFDTNLTSEAGSLELQLTFAWVEMNEDGVGIQRVRKTSTTAIEIIPITAWSDIIPDSALSALDQRLIKMDAQMRGLNDYLEVVDSSKVDNLVYNEKDDTLQLSANGVGVGDKVSVRDILDDGTPVVDFGLNSGSGSGSNSGSNNNSNDGCDCNHDCNCGDDVIEFGDDLTIGKPDENDDSIVEF